MLAIHKKLVVDEHGEPQEVTPGRKSQQIEELLGLDLEPDAVADLEEAARDREAGTSNAYIDLDSI